MRILLLSQFYPPVVGGQEQHVRNLAHALVGRGHRVEVATTAPAGEAGTILDGPVPVHRLATTAQAVARRVPGVYSDPERPHAAPTVDPRLRAGIGRLLAEGPFDVLHAHDWAVNSALGPARRSGVPVVLTQHDYGHLCATKRLMRGGQVCPGPALLACGRCASAQYGAVVGPGVVAANLLGGRARQRGVDAFISVSSAVAASTGLAGRRRSEVIPNFVPDQLVFDSPSPDAGGPLVFIGDLSLDKGIGMLLDAYRRLAEPPPLLLAGRVLPETPLDTPEGVDVLGPLGHGEVMELMRRAMVVVVPSLVPDCCPTVVLEAMATGTPVVAARSGGIVDLVDDGVTGLLVAPGDPAELAAALSRVMGNETLVTEMGRRSIDRVRMFTASAVVARVEELYDRLVSADR
jgi:glycosyltransferase involved in cell wall biosynthesis